MSGKPANTIDENRRRHAFPDDGLLWLFGYGSLIFKADFDFHRRRIATVVGWERRFWQGSHDHRGTEHSPGRVVTLIESPGAVCHGVAYEISARQLSHLDHREKNGYLRYVTQMTFDDGATADGLFYIATPENSAYLGPADEMDIARQIQTAAGPSGRNRDYLLDLAGALRSMSAHDEHVFHMERTLLALDDQ